MQCLNVKTCGTRAYILFKVLIMLTISYEQQTIMKLVT
jgi:hypothetical protein